VRGCPAAWHAAALCWLAAAWPVSAQDAGEGDDAGAGAAAAATATAGQGMVIELEAGAAAPPAGPPQPRELADSGVEMILGGEGKDGIAKRGRLKKED
jgi:hypothetical protein